MTNSVNQSANLVLAQTGADRGRARTRDQLVSIICERIAEGEVIEDICGPDRESDFPTWRTFYKWMLADKDIKNQYNDAVQARLLKFVDSTFKIADDGSNDYMEKLNDKGEVVGWQINGEAVQRSKLRINNIQWYAEKIGRSIFGPSVAVGGHADMPPIKSVAAIGNPEDVYRALLGGGTLLQTQDPEPESYV